VNSVIVNQTEANNLIGCVLGYGHFSTVHPGHIRYLKHARGLGSRLVVAVIGDSESSPYPFSQKERAEALSLLGIADTILLMEDDNLERLIDEVKPVLLVLGNEFRKDKNIEKIIRLQELRGGAVCFHAGDVQYATTDLLVSTEDTIAENKRKVFAIACRRQSIGKEGMVRCIEKFSTCRIAVLGDTIIDQYAACEALGMSAEAPVIVVKELEKKTFLGGAGIVAAHITALGAKCDLVSVIGQDSVSEIVRVKLKDLRVGDEVETDPSRPTTFKKRYIVNNQKLFRVSRLEEHVLDGVVEDKIVKRLLKIGPTANGIVISDFVYGVITPRILKVVRKLAIKHNLMLFGDLQCSSQVGSIAKYKDFSLLCPNEKEARIALCDKNNGLEQISQKLIQETGCKGLIMKLGGDGFITYERCLNGSVRSQAFPALCSNPIDVAGAGDSLLAVMAAGLTSGADIMTTSAIAACMSALAVRTMGNRPISKDDLIRYIHELEPTWESSFHE